MIRKTNMVFGCSPYRGDIETNVANARRYARFIALCGYSPVMPHLMFPQFLDDSKADERIKGIELGVVQMKQCDEMWIFGTKISKGMEYEIDKAKDMNIVVRMFDEDCNEISPVTLKIDDRVGYEFRRIVNGLKFV
jgi:hypothetical protein